MRRNAADATCAKAAAAVACRRRRCSHLHERRCSKSERREAAEVRRWQEAGRNASHSDAEGRRTSRGRNQNGAVDNATSSLDSTTIALLGEERRLGLTATPPYTSRVKQPATPLPQSHTPPAPHALPMPPTHAPPSSNAADAACADAAAVVACRRRRRSPPRERRCYLSQRRQSR